MLHRIWGFTPGFTPLMPGIVFVYFSPMTETNVLFVYVHTVQEKSYIMPKVRQKTSGRHGDPSSSGDSDNETPGPSKNAVKRKSAEQNGVQKSKAGKDDEQNGIIVSDEEVSATPATSDMTGTQRSSSHLEKQFAQMSVQDRERLANDIVRYMLVADFKKYPIKQADIKKHALKDYSRSFNSLMKMASEKLRNVFGVDVVETDCGKQKAYMLINILDNKYDAPHQTWPPEDDVIMGLIMVILSVIFMKGNVLMEEDLFDLLSRLGISLDHPDETYGDVRPLIFADFVRKGYLEVEREHGSDPPTHLFRWGPRAQAETSKRHAMDFICQVFGEDLPQRWTAQMHDIEQSQAAERSAPGSSQTPSTSRSIS